MAKEPLSYQKINPQKAGKITQADQGMNFSSTIHLL
jgi:hypothetical protein